MQSAASTRTTQTDIAKAMQPQNMILPANKKTKKYVSQVPATKQQQPQQTQFQINKAYNVVSILKSSATANSQQASHMSAHQTQSHPQSQSHHQHQSYANVVNRPISAAAQQSTVLCSSGGNLMSVNNCQLNTSDLNSAAIYNMTGHRPQLTGGSAGNSSIIETSCRFVGSMASSLTDMSKVGTISGVNSGGGAGTNTQLNTSAASSCVGNGGSGGGGGGSNGSVGVGNSNGNSANGTNPSLVALANSHGLTLGSSNTPYMHDKSLLGVGVSVGISCIDNRKYDYKNNNLLTNSNFQTAQEYVSTGNNSSNGNTRSNQQSGIYRGPPPTASNAPRNGSGGGGARHVHMPTMYPNMVIQQYPQFGQRQPSYSTPHLQYAHTAISYYPYQYIPPLPQQPPPPPPHSRSGVAVNTSVNIGNSIPVQPGPNGPLAGPGASPSPLQLLTGAVQPGANTVIGVTSTGNGQVGVSPMVGVMQTNVTPQPVPVPVPATNKRRHLHRLQIIHPETRKNILEDYDESNTSTENDVQESGSAGAAVIATSVSSRDTTTAGVSTSGMCVPSNVLLTDPRAIVICKKLDQSPAQRQAVSMGQTPVVSAMSDAPSVEILPTSQNKNKSKKIPIVAPKDGFESKSIDFSTPKVDDAAAKSGNITTASEFILQKQPDCASNEQNSQQQDQQLSSLPQQKEQKEQEQRQQPKKVEQLQELEQQPELEQKQETYSQFMAHKANLSNQIDIVEQDSKQKPKFELKDKVQPGVDVTSLTPNEITVESTPAADLPKSTSQSEEIHPCNTEAAQVSALANNVPTNFISDNASTTKSILSDAVSEPLLNSQTTEPTTTLANAHKITPDETDRAQISPAMEELPKEKTQDTENEKPPNAEIAKESNQTNEIPQPEKVEAETSIVNSESVVNPVSEESALRLPVSLINYNEGQWSPTNPSGKKQYNREQLLLLREAKASRIQPEVKNVSILPQPNLMPLFMRNNNNNNKRVQSMVGTIGGGGGTRNSESGGFVSKQMSMSGVQGRNSTKGMIHVNLSLNQDVKLNETENAWRPRLQAKQDIGNNPDIKSVHEKDELVRKVRGILNKLTPERFDTLVEEIIKLKIDTREKMDEVMVLVFEKAIDEPNFSVSYARLCYRLISEGKASDERMESSTKSNLQHFRNALIDKTEKEFTQNVSQGAAKERKLQPIIEKIKKCTDPNEKAELEAQLEEEERKIRRRSGGTVRFIGELFKISMLTGKIIYSCIDTLLNPKSEDMLECLCKLLTTVGAKFEQTPVNSKDPTRCYSLEKSIARMQEIASKTDKDGAKVSSRVRFMLQDVIDLRKNKWQSTRNEAPKTMGQIEQEAKNEQLSAQYMTYSGSLSTSSPNGTHADSGKRDDRSSSSRFGGGGRDSRSSGYGGSHSQHRADSNMLRHQQTSNSSSNTGSNTHSNGNNDDNTWTVKTSKGSRSQAVDSYKLEGLNLQLNQNLDTKKMGGVNQFINWNNRQSSTPTTTPSNSFAVLSLMDNKSSSSSSDRDCNGPRNKGSYNKGSMERDCYNDRGIHSRTGSSQGSRESSSSRAAQNQQNRGILNSSSLQKSASHSKYTQQAPPNSRLSNKALGPSSSVGGIYRGGSDQQHILLSGSNSSASAKSVATPATFTEPSQSDIKLFKSVLLEIFGDAQYSVKCIQRIPESDRCGFLYYLLTDYLHLAKVDKKNRRYLALTVAQQIEENLISVDDFKLAYNKFFEGAFDLTLDVPELWLYIHQFTGPLLIKNHLTVADLWNKTQIDNTTQFGMGKSFLNSFLIYSTREVGPNYTRSIWKKYGMRWSDYMPESDVKDFIELNRLEYVENVLKAPVIEERESHETHVKNVIDHIGHLLKEGATADSVIDYSNGNIVKADKVFIRGLTETLSNFAIVYKDNIYKLDPEIFQKICIPVFQRYIELKEDLQLECLYGVQLLVHSLEHPRGLLGELFGELYVAFVIQKESIYKWRDSKDHSAGKGVAVKSLNPFLNSLFHDENN